WVTTLIEASEVVSALSMEGVDRWDTNASPANKVTQKRDRTGKRQTAGDVTVVKDINMALDGGSEVGKGGVRTPNAAELSGIRPSHSQSVYLSSVGIPPKKGVRSLLPVQLGRF
ncbi:MAG: hypothetical protein AAGD07_10575, partial [Planctomycetota bacterium]